MLRPFNGLLSSSRPSFENCFDLLSRFCSARTATNNWVKALKMSSRFEKFSHVFSGFTPAWKRWLCCFDICRFFSTAWRQFKCAFVYFMLLVNKQIKILRPYMTCRPKCLLMIKFRHKGPIITEITKTYIKSFCASVRLRHSEIFGNN